MKIKIKVHPSAAGLFGARAKVTITPFGTFDSGVKYHATRRGASDAARSVVYSAIARAYAKRAGYYE